MFLCPLFIQQIFIALKVTEAISLNLHFLVFVIVPCLLFFVKLFRYGTD